MKKLISLLMSAALTAVLIPANVIAADTDIYIDDPVIEEPHEHCENEKSELSISGSTATCKSTITGYSEVTDIYINQTLYRYVSGNWVFYKHWSEHQYTKNGSLTNYAYNIPSGSYYLHSEFTVDYPGGYELASKDSAVCSK